MEFVDIVYSMGMLYILSKAFFSENISIPVFFFVVLYGALFSGALFFYYCIEHGLIEVDYTHYIIIQSLFCFILGIVALAFIGGFLSVIFASFQVISILLNVASGIIYTTASADNYSGFVLVYNTYNYALVFIDLLILWRLIHGSPKQHSIS